MPREKRAADLLKVSPGGVGLKDKDDADLYPEEQEEVAPVTFYHWLGRDHEGRARPGVGIIHIAGGNTVVAEGRRLKMPLHDAVFNGGLCTTNDPIVIDGLRKMIRQSARRGEACGVSENVEEFYAATLPDSKKLQREREQAARTIDGLKDETSRLRALLEENGINPNPREGAAA